MTEVVGGGCAGKILDIDHVWNAPQLKVSAANRPRGNQQIKRHIRAKLVLMDSKMIHVYNEQLDHSRTWRNIAANGGEAEVRDGSVPGRWINPH